MIIIIGGLDTFEPWIKNVEWKGSSNSPDSRITLKCTSLEENKGHCQSSPCENGGTCYNGLTSFHCECKPGWTGKTCDKQCKLKNVFTFVCNSYRDNKNCSFLAHFGAVCTSIVVTGDDYGSVTGSYFISEEKSSSSPEKPTYKLDGMDRYIFFYPSKKGWREGRYEGMTTSRFLYTSKKYKWVEFTI